MKTPNKVLGGSLIIYFVFVFVVPIAARAATTPSLGTASTFGVLGSTYSNTVSGTTINGDLGYITGPAMVPTVNGATHINNAARLQAGADQTTALTDLNGQACVSLGAAVTLSGTYTPGCYSSTGAMDIVASATVTLNGSGTYIFRPGGALTTGANSIISLTGGAIASDVFWTPTAATTLGANSTFVGTNIDNAGITIGSTVAWTGRALAFSGTISTDADIITAPATLRVVKAVTNDNGGTVVASGFNLHIKLSGADVSGSPAVGVVSPGTSYSLLAGTYLVSEDTNAPYTQSFSGDCNSSGSVTLSAGQDKTCTITNNDIAPALHLRKTVILDNGGTALNTAWTLTATGTGGSPTNLTGATPIDSGASFKADTYTLAEISGPSGYTASSWVCVGGTQVGSTITLALGANATCTITNDDIAPVVIPPATLRIIKTVVNNSGGVAIASGFNLHVKLSGTDVAGSPAVGIVAPGTSYSLSAGTYVVSEDANTGYVAAFSGDCNLSGSVTLAAGESKTCTITNDDIAPVVIPPATLHVVKQVVNNSGGVVIASGFNLHVKLSGTDVSGSPAVGVASPGRSYSLLAGTYVVSEDANTGYVAAFSGDCNSSGTITLVSGDDKICTITNDDIAPAPPVPATLHVIKTVVNDSGGVATASAFSLHVKLSGVDVSGSPAAGVASLGISYSLLAGTYVVSEDANSSYAQSFSGDCNASGSVTLAAGENKTCTITNDDIAVPVVILPASINVVKTVINDNGRTKTVADFPLFVSGTPVTSGVTNVFPAPATYTVTETVDPNYTQTFSGDCAAGGTMNLAPGDNRFCIITNNDIAAPVIAAAPSSTGGSGSIQAPPVPPLIDVVKVPIPLALPAGPGSVTYTYTLRNVGTVSVANITMVGDTCSPITLVSGDSNGDSRLDVNETWVHTCSTTLSATHTNTVTATGWANGISAVDIASATVVVGLPIVPPLIHVTKIPSPLVFRAGGGTVTYTKKVTNPGTVPLANVRLTDDKCGPVKYISGDTNGDSKLDPVETWTYTCRTNLTNTTTNTVIAEGDANGLTARDFAIATVVVAAAVPKLPNTGVAPDEKSAPWNIVVLVDILMLVSNSFVVAFQKSIR